MIDSNVKNITLYTKGCYGCDRDNRFSELRHLILRSSLPLGTLVVKRIELSREWVTEANALHKELPAVTINFIDGSTKNMAYEDFIGIHSQIGSKNARSTKKTAR